MQKKSNGCRATATTSDGVLHELDTRVVVFRTRRIDDRVSVPCLVGAGVFRVAARRGQACFKRGANFQRSRYRPAATCTAGHKSPDLAAAGLACRDHPNGSGRCLSLATRRADLDSAIALAWARLFTEDELNAIAEFYSSPAGKKFAEVTPELSSITIQTVDGWSNRVGEELLDKSREELKKQGHEL